MTVLLFSCVSFILKINNVLTEFMHKIHIQIIIVKKFIVFIILHIGDDLVGYE